MISGFNTDVEFDNVVYHVQTEDKGEKSHLIVSLVYNGGTILASKRASYEDMAIAGVDPNALAERVQRQHQLICAAVRAGRMNELKGMAARDRKAVAKTEPVTIVLPPVTVPEPVLKEKVVANAAPVAKAHEVSVPTSPVIEQQRPRAAAPVGVIDAVETIPVYEIFDDSPLVEGVSIVEEDAVLPAEAVAVVSEFSGIERPTNTKLSLELLGESKFKGGERRTVTVMVCRGTERRVISNAEIMIKVLGSSFRPLIFHAKSDVNGLAKVHMQLPHFEAGRAALFIRGNK